MDGAGGGTGGKEGPAGRLGCKGLLLITLAQPHATALIMAECVMLF